MPTSKRNSIKLATSNNTWSGTHAHPSMVPIPADIRGPCRASFKIHYVRKDMTSYAQSVKFDNDSFFAWHIDQLVVYADVLASVPDSLDRRFIPRLAILLPSQE